MSAEPLAFPVDPEEQAHADGIARWKHLTETALPEKAAQQNWPLRLDHCFKRVCLDFAFSDVWYRHLKRPAERHLSGNALRLALECAETLLSQGEPLLQQRNLESLRYRGKLKAHKLTGHSEASAAKHL